MKRYLVLAAILASLMCAAEKGHAQEALPPAADAALEVSQRLMAEAQRQRAAEQRLAQLVADYQAMVEDLESNNLVKQGGANELAAAAAVLAALKDQNVPEAAARIEAARSQLTQLQPNLQVAGHEIGIIITQLDQLLQKTGSQHEQLINSLASAIQRQEQVHQATRQWGRDLYQQPQQARERAPELKTRQEQVAREVDRLREDLTHAIAQETDPLERSQLEQAQDMLGKTDPAGQLDHAAQDIENQQPVAAVQKQQKALEDLRQALRAMQPDQTLADLGQMREAREQLEQVRQAQAALRAQLQAKAPEQLKRDKLALQAEQRKLSRQIDQIEAPSSPDAAAQAKQAARDAMQDAEKQVLAENQQAAAQAQQQAEQKLGEAIEKLDQQIAQAQKNLQGETLAGEQMRQLQAQQEQLAQQTRRAAEQQASTAPLAPAQESLSQRTQSMAQSQPHSAAAQRAAQAMQQAATAMQQNQSAAAQQKQQEAIDALSQAIAEAAQSMPAPAADPGQQTEMASAPQQPGADGRGSEEGPVGDRETSARAQQRPTSEDANWRALAQRQREALTQKYASELPIEYRELLKDYYETLAE